MSEQTTVEQRAESLRKLAELMTKPDVAKFLAQSDEMGATLPPGVNPMQCSACCSSHGGGAAKQR